MSWWRQFWNNLWALISGRPAPLEAVRVNELPEKLATNCTYIVGEGAYTWYLAMMCPCGCKETLHMSLMADDQPRWQLTEHSDGTASLSPSVWRQKGCHSHFFLRRGKIDWCAPPWKVKR